MKARYFCILLVFFCTLFLFFVTKSAKAEFAKAESIPMTCEEKLNLLEPAAPKTIYDSELMPDRDISKFEEETLPISLIKRIGSKLPFVTVYKDLKWQRPAYAADWHSSYWRWSYVPLHMAYQQHIVYDYEGGLSWWYDLSHELALPDEADVPSPINEAAFTIKYPYVVRLIVFKFDVKSIKHYKNQILVTGNPQRKGLTIVDFDTSKLSDSKKLLQLATPDEYEVDYLILPLNGH